MHILWYEPFGLDWDWLTWSIGETEQEKEEEKSN